MTLTDADISAITEAFEVIAGPVSGTLVPEAPRMLAADRDWWLRATDLLAKIGAAQEASGQDWSPDQLRAIILCAAGRTEEDCPPGTAGVAARDLRPGDVLVAGDETGYRYYRVEEACAGCHGDRARQDMVTADLVPVTADGHPCGDRLPLALRADETVDALVPRPPASTEAAPEPDGARES
jgi:hypothetical protein